MADFVYVMADFVFVVYCCGHGLQIRAIGDVVSFFKKKGASAPSFVQSVKGQKSKRILIPEAAHRETVCLIVVVTVDIAVEIIQVAAPGE